MAIKFLHIREIDDEAKIMSFGGLTIAYTIVDSPSIAGICIHLSKCHPDDRFCYETGRQLASKKLQNDGPLDIISISHPISYAIIDWLCNQWWPSRRKYGGFTINIWQDVNHRWVSHFTPSQSYITG